MGHDESGAARNEQAVRRFWGDVWSEGRVEVLDEVYADVVQQSGRPVSREDMAEVVTGEREGFPDLRIEIDKLVACGDHVTTYSRVVGTQTGAYGRIEATGRKVDVPMCDLFRLEDGRIVEHWHAADHFVLARQLDAVPNPF